MQSEETQRIMASLEELKGLVSNMISAYNETAPGPKTTKAAQNAAEADAAVAKYFAPVPESYTPYTPVTDADLLQNRNAESPRGKVWLTTAKAAAGYIVANGGPDCAGQVARALTRAGFSGNTMRCGSIGVAYVYAVRLRAVALAPVAE